MKLAAPVDKYVTTLIPELYSAPFLLVEQTAADEATGLQPAEREGFFIPKVHFYAAAFHAAAAAAVM